jgi:DNA-binding MarR family transcriptional regulator
MSNLDFPVWMRILRLLNRYDELYPSQIAKDLDVTYSHVNKMCSVLYREKLVAFKRTGRTMFLSLTPKGKLLADNVDAVMSGLNVDLKKKFNINSVMKVG